MNTLVMIGWVRKQKDIASSPDGVSFHFNQEDAEAFSDEWWEEIEAENGILPDDYSYPVIYNPRVVEAHGNLFERVFNTKNGLRLSQEELEVLGEEA